VGRIRLGFSVNTRPDPLFAALHRHEQDLLPKLGREGAKVELLLICKHLVADLKRHRAGIALNSIGHADPCCQVGLCVVRTDVHARLDDMGQQDGDERGHGGCRVWKVGWGKGG